MAPTRHQLANAVRALSMDAVQKANSGHPGAPMGMADIAEVLWNDFLKHNPGNPAWPDRDRFVFSNGHGSMLLYSVLHLSGYDLGIEEIKNFRQLHSKTPGHPEYGYTPGVETTSGPLGQGIANAVGMAIAERTLAAQFNRPGHEIVDHHTYVFLGDGCMMEGISHEACSLAGTLGLNKLIAIYDDNGISIDGEVEGWFTEDIPGRFAAYGWKVIAEVDGHDPEAIKAAINEARAEQAKPTLICCKTIIGCCSPNKQGKEICHGAPLGEEEIALTRAEMDWPHGPFEIPAEIYAGWNARERGGQAEAAWQEKLAAYQQAHPEAAAELKRRLAGELPADWAAKSQAFIAESEAKAAKVASRKASQLALEGYGPLLPELIGGSADLAGSNLTIWSGSKDIKQDQAGNYIYFGVREFAMVAIGNGLALHGGFIPYTATFLIFSDYARNAIRMAALMKQRALFVLTHDSIGLGEDGPTHQPIEQTSSLRLIPNLNVWRPCDAVETAVAWQQAVERKEGPSALLLSRQGLPHQERSAEQSAAIARGGYVLRDCDTTPELIIMATGSEVELAVAAAEQLNQQGRPTRVVSLPCVEVFEAQDEAYQQQVLPDAVSKRIAIEAGCTTGWYKYVGRKGQVIGLDRFGESAPAGELFKLFGFTVEKVAEAAARL
ncbi:transketolase [Desulfurivibrio alkaliphilus]|uniref:Transketolase n=1 Tax=Desulfurivibrio alkaliphilus (strain DSM 19089 / UNIQEM U267 / AHT2) TaxID=589865 RepID=D6Z019_DESAT|nr:transketolase [Desulfurivibrio alkaliphilus]ADH85176.1 transketolase [Desulfurivibrio alkaliphilus AHT 2]